MDTAFRPTFFKNGYWMWDEVNNGLLFVSRDVNTRLPSMTNLSARSAPKRSKHELRFHEAIDALEQVRFRRYHQRKCKPKEPRVVTIQDIKDIAIYTANYKDFSRDFIKYFHTPTMDRFLRSLIVYFQNYIQVWESLLVKREEAKRKLYQPTVTLMENLLRDDLADLRAMVAKEYGTILVGAEDVKRFHHMNNKNNVSSSDKDRILFEALVPMAVRVVWIALQRKNLNLIELELNRLLRSNVFNITAHRGLRGGADLDKSAHEERILTGLANTEEMKLLHRSPVTKELVLGRHDYRMLMIGVKEFQPSDQRLKYLEAAFSAPEELLWKLNVKVGLLGIPREDYDTMLMNIAGVNKRRQSFTPRVSPDFKLPPIIREHTMAKTYPVNPPPFHETTQTIKARKTQCKMWLQTMHRASIGDISTLDLSISQSHAMLLTSRSTISIVTDKK